MKFFVFLFLNLFFASSAFAAQLTLQARLANDSPPIKHGLEWRIFEAKKNDDGSLKEIAHQQGGTINIELPANQYIIHASLGIIGDVRKIEIDNTNKTEQFIFNAGAIRLSASANNKKIDTQYLTFDIFEKNINENGQRKLIASNIKQDEILYLKADTYHVVSNYGNVNASVSIDLEVRADKITDTIFQHRAAKISMRLVSAQGGAAIANTIWSIITEQGRTVFDSALIEPHLVLSEGKYQATVRHSGNTYIKEFDVKTGQQQHLELLITN